MTSTSKKQAHLDHTGTPWQVSKVGSRVYVESATEMYLSGLTGKAEHVQITGNIKLGNAKFIVTAVNSYDAMKQALEAYLAKFDDTSLSNLEVKQWLDETGIPAMRNALKEANK